MKNILILIFALLFISVSISKNNKEKEDLTVEVKYNGKTHLIKNADTVHLGYGSYPDGNFMYINTGGKIPMRKEFASKTAIVYKVVYWKTVDQYQIYIKGKFGKYAVDIPQAVEKEEIVGFNQTFFK